MLGSLPSFLLIVLLKKIMTGSAGHSLSCLPSPLISSVRPFVPLVSHLWELLNQPIPFRKPCGSAVLAAVPFTSKYSLSVGSYRGVMPPSHLVPGKTKGWSLAIFPGQEGRVKEKLLWSTGF